MAHYLSASEHRIAVFHGFDISEYAIDASGVLKIDDSEHGFVAVKTGGSFHLEKVYAASSSEHGQKAYSFESDVPNGPVYQPIHASMTPEDIEGATIAVDDGTHWLFYHATKEQEQSHELVLQGAIVGLFQTFLDEITIAMDRASSTSVKTGHRLKFYDLVGFRNQIIADVRDEHRKRYIGERAKNPDDHHIHSDIRVSLKKIKAQRETLSADAFVRISTEVNNILKILEGAHDYETRWERAAKEEAKKKAAEVPSEGTEANGNEGDTPSE